MKNRHLLVLRKLDEEQETGDSALPLQKQGGEDKYVHYNEDGLKE